MSRHLPIIEDLAVTPQSFRACQDAIRRQLQQEDEETGLQLFREPLEAVLMLSYEQGLAVVQQEDYTAMWALYDALQEIVQDFRAATAQEWQDVGSPPTILVEEVVHLLAAWTAELGEVLGEEPGRVAVSA